VGVIYGPVEFAHFKRFFCFPLVLEYFKSTRLTALHIVDQLSPPPKKKYPEKEKQKKNKRRFSFFMAQFWSGIEKGKR
jgi:hypothetical protein